MKLILNSCLAASLVLVACGGRQSKGIERVPDPIADVHAKELYDTAAMLERAGDHIRAEQYYGAARSKGYSESETTRALMRVCIASSRHRSALNHAEAYLERHPDAWRLRYLAASLMVGLEDSEGAERALRRVIRDQPKFAEAHYLMGVLLQRDAEAARPYFEQYLALKPDGRHADESREILNPPRAKTGIVRIEDSDESVDE